jgi:hypothetical protein
MSIQLQDVLLLKMLQGESFSWFKISYVMLLYVQCTICTDTDDKEVCTSFVRMKETWLWL